MHEPVRVAIVDDHPVVRAGLRAMLDRHDDLDVTAECATGGDAIEHHDLANTDVVILDLNLPDVRGERVAVALRERYPNIRIIVLTMEHDDTRLVAALRAGADAYLLKGADPEELVNAVRSVARGEFVIGRGASEAVATLLRNGRTNAEAAFPNLTPREREVIALIARNATNDDIARRLALSPKTVRNLVSLVLVKINARDRADAVLRARAAGLE